MPRTIEEGFNDFNDKLKITKTESDAVKSHRASIEDCMRNNFGMNRFFRTGSIGNGTNVSGYSDTDYFAGIPRDNLHENSATTLRKIKESLQERFPKTDIYVDSPAVVVDFGDVASETTEIIPADYIKTENESNIYDIPNGSSGWMRSSPKANNEYVTKINSKISYKVKPLIRFIKAWKFYNKVPISSFYLEMRVTKFISQEETIIYSIDIKNIFKHLIDIDLANMINPSGIGGYIQGCKSDADKTTAISKLKTAYSRACKAREQEEKGDIKEAFGRRNLLFNEKFTSFYY